MPSLPKEIAAFMERYKVDSDELWCVHNKTWVIKHRALERVAAETGITFERPSVIACDLASKSMIICTFGKLGDRSEWSFGEVSPDNNKNQYMAAMAEKRSRDRVILKLLAAHGALYSEAEADEFTQPRQNLHETMSGNTVSDEDIITRVDGIQVLTVDAQRVIFSELDKELTGCDTVEGLKRWKVTARTRASRLSDHWRKDLEGRYLKHLRQLEKRDADEYRERMAG